MAAKHDGKHARANFWVTQQNLAKQKGGRPLYQFKERKHPKVAKSAPVPVRPAEEKVEATSPEESAAPAPAETRATSEERASSKGSANEE